MITTRTVFGTNNSLKPNLACFCKFIQNQTMEIVFSVYQETNGGFVAECLSLATSLLKAIPGTN